MPGDAVLGAQGGLVDLGGRGCGADSAEPEGVGPESIAGPESRSDIVRAADVVQHDGHAARWQGAVFFCAETAQFGI